MADSFDYVDPSDQPARRSSRGRQPARAAFVPDGPTDGSANRAARPAVRRRSPAPAAPRRAAPRAKTARRKRDRDPTPEPASESESETEFLDSEDEREASRASKRRNKAATAAANHRENLTAAAAGRIARILHNKTWLCLNNCRRGWLYCNI